MSHVLNPKNWKGFYLPQRFCVQSTFNHTRLDSWQEERKAKKVDKPFSSRLLIHSEAIHMKKKNRVKIVHNQGKVHYHSHWRNDQNAVYWVKLPKAQDLGLQIGKQTQTLFIVHQSVPNLCIERVVSDNGDRILSQRILTPRPEPKVTLRNTWRSQQQHNAAAQSSESDLGPWKPLQAEKGHTIF